MDKNYKEFVEEVAETLPDHMPAGVWEISTIQVDKLQGESYYGIAVKSGAALGLSMNLEQQFRAWEDGESMESVLRSIAELASQSLDNAPADIGNLADYQAMKEKLIMQVISPVGNENMLETVPHKKLADLAVVYRVALSERATVLVTHAILKKWGISAAQLIADAEVFAPIHHPAGIIPLRLVLLELMGLPADSDALPADRDELLVASCNDDYYGAGCIAYPGFLELVEETLAGGYYILPVSVHEVLLVPDAAGLTPENLKTMVADINATEVAAEDRLSNSVYHYDKQHHLQIAG